MGSLEAFYESGDGDEEMRLAFPEHRLEFLTASEYMNTYIPPCSRILDNSAGTGVYSFYLAERGHVVTAGDIVPHNVDIINENALLHSAPLKSTMVLDATDCGVFGRETFDVVLLMGAYYHLTDGAARDRALLEANRILVSGGLLFLTYINRFSVILANMSGGVDNIDEINDFLGTGIEDIFYTSTPDATAGDVLLSGFEIVKHISLDGISNYLFNVTGKIDKAGLRNFGKYHAKTRENSELLGYGYHNMIIARKM
ncbi:hypothetical protein FACS189499_07200 [Clostridia bacterium]|nr:hypothetical protein FACS189499_07200 [Clostridia bacterium]